MIVLDSSFLIAYHNTRDVHHAAATRGVEALLAGEWGQALLLEYVFLEVVTVLLARRGLSTATEVGSALLGARELDFVPCADLFLDAFHIFRSQGESALSFTDAAIVAAAKQRGAKLVATFDEDFRTIAGLTVVPN